MSVETTVSRQVLEQVADGFHQLIALKAQQAATQAELIRWCVRELRADNNHHRIRGHESFAEQRRIRDENRKNKALALLYLEWLATSLERAAGVDIAPPATIITAP